MVCFIKVEWVERAKLPGRSEERKEGREGKKNKWTDRKN